MRNAARICQNECYQYNSGQNIFPHRDMLLVAFSNKLQFVVFDQNVRAVYSIQAYSLVLSLPPMLTFLILLLTPINPDSPSLPSFICLYVAHIFCHLKRLIIKRLLVFWMGTPLNHRWTWTAFKEVCSWSRSESGLGTSRSKTPPCGCMFKSQRVSAKLNWCWI